MDDEAVASAAPGERRCGRAGEEQADALDWAAVRRAYEEGPDPVAAIISRFGLTAAQLRYWRKKDGWKARPQIGGPHRGSVAADQLRLMLTMHATLNRRLAIAVSKADDFELRHALALNLRVDSFRLLRPPRRSDMAKGTKPAAAPRRDRGAEKKSNDAEQQRADNLARLRAELKKRLDQIMETEERS